VTRDLRLRGPSAGGFAGVPTRAGRNEIRAYALPSATRFEDDVEAVDQVFAAHDRASVSAQSHGIFACGGKGPFPAASRYETICWRSSSHKQARKHSTILRSPSVIVTGVCSFGMAAMASGRR
jgi:hypothetical protein